MLFKILKRFLIYINMLKQFNKFYLLSFFAVIFFFKASSQTGAEKRLISQKFVYKTSKVSEVYIVWGTNFWKTPEKKYWPKNTYLKEKLAYTKMTHHGDSFYTSFTLPYASRLDYYFMMTVSHNGKGKYGWDTNLKINYSSDFINNKLVELNDSKLNIQQPRFSILSLGSQFMVLSLCLFPLVFFLFRQSRRTNNTVILSGLLITAFIYIFLARFEIAELYHKKATIVVGAVFSDLLWLLTISILFFPLIYFLRKKIIVRNILFVIFSVVIVCTVLASLLNIEVVKQLGTPFNYKWLYYSDFLKGNDARAGITKTLTTHLLENFLMLIVSFIIIGLSVSILLQKLLLNKRLAKFIFSALFLFTLTSFYEYKTKNYKNGKVQAPAIAFISSIFFPGGIDELLKMKISDETARYLSDCCNNFNTSKSDSTIRIDNIILFVSESTPKQYISVYDSAFACTPNLKKWRSISKAYTNMYSPIPSTPNSMFSLTSGIYPMVDYKSVLGEKLQLPIASLPKILNDKGWATSLFFSSDLRYSNMDEYTKNQSYSTIKDFTTMPCVKKFSITHSNLDGLNDECLAENYFKWIDSMPLKKKYSMLWTNQTHYPYYTDSATVYTSENDDLNRFLNALHHTDEVFGQLMSELEKRNMLKTTLVIFIADHGEAFSTHDQTLHASRVYEENVHIPCILFNPVLFKNTFNNQIHNLIDIDVTITNLLGLEKPGEWQGKSLLGDTTAVRTFFFSPYTDLILGTRDKDWKYIYNADTKESELYNLVSDPKELKNISFQHPEAVQKEHEILAAWVQYQDKKYKGWKGTKTKLK
jgi:arylsulfatase A-like enzyme